MVLRKVLSLSNIIEQRNLCSLSLNIKTKWEIQEKRKKLSSRRETELDFI
jgi:hypothetical protein